MPAQAVLSEPLGSMLRSYHSSHTAEFLLIRFQSHTAASFHFRSPPAGQTFSRIRTSFDSQSTRLMHFMLTSVRCFLISSSTQPSVSTSHFLFLLPPCKYNKNLLFIHVIRFIIVIRDNTDLSRRHSNFTGQKSSQARISLCREKTKVAQNLHDSSIVRP